MMSPRVFTVGVRGKNWDQDVIALSLGKAKAEYLRDIQDVWPDVKYTDITGRVSSGFSMATLADFQRIADYRDVPFAKIGMRVKVGEWPGIIVGKNESANFNILFLDGKFKAQTLNCHPNNCITYFDSKGEVIKQFP